MPWGEQNENPERCCLQTHKPCSPHGSAYQEDQKCSAVRHLYHAVSLWNHKHVTSWIWYFPPVDKIIGMRMYMKEDWKLSKQCMPLKEVHLHNTALQPGRPNTCSLQETHVQKRELLSVLRNYFLPLLSEAGSLAILEVGWWPARSWFHSSGVTDIHDQAWRFAWVLSIWTQTLMPVQHVFLMSAHLPNPRNRVLKWLLSSKYDSHIFETLSLFSLYEGDVLETTAGWNKTHKEFIDAQTQGSFSIEAKNNLLKLGLCNPSSRGSFATQVQL